MQPNFEVLQPTGVLDMTQGNQFRERVESMIDAGIRLILVDLQSVSFMDSSGLAALVTALKAMNAAKGRLCLCALTDEVNLLFELTSMTRVFEIFTDRTEFMQSLTAVQ